MIADRLAPAVDETFANYGELSSAVLFTGAVLYSFQIYCDFSGYSDIGIGAAKVMNIKLMENFNQPYISKNISEFWSRWHISLSTWFRDYVYIPLGGNRKGEGKRKRNVLTVFLLSGLWHGANWTFIVWGGLHGLLTVWLPGKTHINEHRVKATNIFKAVCLFITVTFFWIFFRAENITHALNYIKGILSFKGGINHLALNSAELLFSIAVITIMMLKEYYYPKHVIESRKKYTLYVLVMVLACYFFGVFEENQFIYFQF